MRIPKTVIKKLIKINNNALDNKKLSHEIEEWLGKKGIDIDILRQNTLSVMEMAEYGELDIENVERNLLVNLEDYRNLD